MTAAAGRTRKSDVGVAVNVAVNGEGVTGDSEDDVAAADEGEDEIKGGKKVRVAADVRVDDGDSGSARHCVASPEGTVPVAHGAHAGEPGSIATVPGPQRVHRALVEPLPEVVPAGQSSQSVTCVPRMPTSTFPGSVVLWICSGEAPVRFQNLSVGVLSA